MIPCRVSHRSSQQFRAHIELKGSDRKGTQEERYLVDARRAILRIQQYSFRDRWIWIALHSVPRFTNRCTHSEFLPKLAIRGTFLLVQLVRGLLLVSPLYMMNE